MKNTNRLLLTTVFAAALLSLFVSAFQVPTVQAAEMTVPEKSLLILDEVAGFNMTAYAPILRTSRQSSFLTLPKEVNDFTLVSGDSSCRAMCTFVNNRLQQVYMSNYSGQPKMNQASLNTLESAKAFMARYDAYIVDFDCSAMRSLLDSIQTAENVTKEVGNTSLMVTVIDQSFAEYVWTYVDENGVPAPIKNVALSYRDGFLKCFQNNWQFYSVASKPEISSSQAVEIAMNAINDYSEMVVMPDDTTKPVSGFRVQSIGQTVLNYQNCREAVLARGGDPFTLYPTWIVPLGFDNICDGGISGAYVRLWADTGEVNDISPMTGGYLHQPDSDSQPKELLNNFDALLTIATFGWVPILFLKWKRSLLSSTKAARKQFFQLITILLCASMSVTLVSGVVVPEVQAIDSRALIYASLYGQLTAEVASAEYVCDYLEDLFDNAGYDSVLNAYGEGTIKNSILANASYSESNFDFVTVFHFGHRYDVGVCFDNDGTLVSWADIDDYTTQGKHYFVFVWACEQASDPTLAEAWAYDLFDGDHCFLGFAGASPNLWAYSYTYIGWQAFRGEDLICTFYSYALDYEYSIYDSLDVTSYDLVGWDIDSPYGLAQFCSYWPENPTFPHPPGPEPGWYWGGFGYYGNPDICLT